MTLTRARHKLPDYIRDALNERKPMDAYRERPDYQQNDYIGWITRAKRDETKQKRLSQMLDELEHGNVYMNMSWKKATQLATDLHEITHHQPICFSARQPE